MPDAAPRIDRVSEAATGIVLGKEREIWQTGVELIGLESPEADAEMIAMAVEGLQAVGAGEFTIDLGQCAFLRGILDSLPLPAPALMESRALPRS